MNGFKEHPDAWIHVDKILDKAQSPNTKFFALQILDEAVNVSLALIFINVDPMENSARRTETRHSSVYYHTSGAYLRAGRCIREKPAFTHKTQCNSHIYCKVRVDYFMAELCA
jgi:hypothetical protein